MNLLDLIESILRKEARALTSWELVAKIQNSYPAALTGKTPNKTVNARISEDLKINGTTSKFSRVNSSQFALREWGLAEVAVPERRIAPIEEEIAVIPRTDFTSILQDKDTSLYNIPFHLLFKKAIPMRRLDAEETLEFVQLISAFAVVRNGEILSFRRTKKLPEQRLHGAISLNFGGHIEFDDAPTLFRDDENVIITMLHRELYEELRFRPNKFIMEYLGTVYLTGNNFEIQHAGIVFLVRIDENVTIESKEPGYHTGLNFIDLRKAASESGKFDTWSSTILSEIVNNHV